MPDRRLPLTLTLTPHATSYETEKAGLIVDGCVQIEFSNAYLHTLDLILFVIICLQQISSLEGDGSLQMTLIEDKHLMLSSGSQIRVRPLVKQGFQ